MINKQKAWFLTLFSLILILSVYYITMPSELLVAPKTSNVTTKQKEKVSVTKSDTLAVLQVEKDEERTALQAEYNEILTNSNTTTEEKNNAYNGLKEIDELKTKEEAIQKLLKKKLKLTAFVKIDGNNVSVTVNKKNHDYSLANNIMRLINENMKNKMYISVKFEK